jgi:tRNA-splicing ligase RtcB
VNPQPVGNLLLVWGADGIEPNTISQACMTAKLPFVHSHVALMPDAHVGIGATVGSVIATSGAIIPAAVGVDIGCGMIASPTNLTSHDLPDDLAGLHSKIAIAIPAGVGKGHSTRNTYGEHVKNVTLDHWSRYEQQPEMVQKANGLWSKTTSQFGTLGSGNHFVEVCLDQNDRVWIVLHSGSRGVGNEIAKRHIEGAKRLMKKYFIGLEDPDLAYFAEHTPEFEEYIHDMLWAQTYAKESRDAMMRAALGALESELSDGKELCWGHINIAGQPPNPFVNCHHNYTEREHHMGRDLWVTRKGAIRAREGDRGIIPGSMATGTYIVEGLGNPASFTSASHGAGRRMSRKKARESVTEDELREAMTGKAWNETAAKTLLDETPAAYKPIEDVMHAQSDLVRVTHTLTQVLNYKGT